MCTAHFLFGLAHTHTPIHMHTHTWTHAKPHTHAHMHARKHAHTHRDIPHTIQTDIPIKHLMNYTHNACM